jgi:ATP-dependent DNA helicase RecQ
MSPSSSVRGLSPDWVTVRETILKRDNYRCVECGIPCTHSEADIHHLLPRSVGGSDEPSNLVTLCDGCHAAHHPQLAGHLARRMMEKWAVRLAFWLDRHGAISDANRNFGAALRLFGLDRFRDGQLPVVQAALAGRSVLVVSPTGFGKTLCFQLPSILRPGVSVVVSPLKALMGEQVSALLRRKIPSTFINSDLDSAEKQVRYRLLGNKRFKLLYAVPERFFVKNKRELQTLRSLRPSFLVIDEAHCVDQWGRDFRPEYGKLGEVREAFGSPPVLAFTATAGQEMQNHLSAVPHPKHERGQGNNLRAGQKNRRDAASLSSRSGFGDPILSFQTSVRLGEGTADQKVCRGEPAACRPDYLYKCFWYGSRRSECATSYSLAAPIVRRGLPSGVWPRWA